MEEKLYEKLIAVECGDLMQAEQVSAYLRATMVAAGVSYNPDLYEKSMVMLARASTE